jgi:hypothetical protein
MKKIMFFLTLMVAVQSHAQEISKTPIPPIMYENLIRPLMTEITEITRLPLPKEQPKVYLASRQAIEEAYCKNAGHDCHVAAITDDKTGEILISPTLLQINLFTASVVFHELVHWAQVKNGMFKNESDCRHWAKSEQHAYTAQSRFLQKHGAAGFAVPNLLEQCK